MNARLFITGLILITSCAVWAGDADMLRLKANAVANGTDLYARDTAVRMARQTCIIQVLEHWIPDEYFDAFRSLILRDDLFVESDRLIESATKDGRTQVEVEVMLNAGRLARDAAAIASTLLSGPPVIAISAPTNATAEDKITTDVIRHLLEEHGLEVQPPAPCPAELWTAEDKAPLRAFTHAQDADVLLWLETKATPSQQADYVNTIDATTTVRVLAAWPPEPTVAEMARTSRVSAQDIEDAKEGAIRDAAGKIATDILDEIDKAALSRLRADTLVQIRIEGTFAEEDLAMLEKRLADLKGVSDIDLLCRTDQLTRLAFGYDDKLGVLVKHLSRMRLKNTRLNVRTVLGKDIRLELAPL